MQVFLVKKNYKEFDVWISEVVDAFANEQDAIDEELNLNLRRTPEDHNDYVEYVSEPLNVKESR